MRKQFWSENQLENREGGEEDSTNVNLKAESCDRMGE
jgi:hypothetical protein